MHGAGSVAACTLKAGRNYAFESASFCDTRVVLRNAAGKVLKTSGLASDNGDDGFEFRSATTKDYFVEYFDAAPDVCLEYAGPYPHGYSGNVAMEVRGDTTTRGTIAPGQLGTSSWLTGPRGATVAPTAPLLHLPVDAALVRF